MDFSLSQDQIELKNEIVEFAQQNLNEAIQSRDKAQLFDRAFWDLCSDIGLPGLSIPKAYGGKGLSPLTTVVALEGLGYGSRDNGLNLAISAHLLACAVPIWEFGNEQQKNDFLPDLCSGKKIAANAISEPDSGSDVFCMQTRAEKFEDGYRINGKKNSITNAPIADILLVYAANDVGKRFLGGITAFILDTNIHDVEVFGPVDKVGVRTAAMGDICINDLIVDKHLILGKEGIGGPIFSRSMEWERICLGACHVGTMQRMLEEAITFTRRRKSGGQAIAKFQAISHQIAEMKTQVQAAKLMIYHAAWKLENNANVSVDAAMSKLFVSETFKNIAMKLMQIYAGCGFRLDNGHEIERMLRDALAATLYSGTSEIQKNIIAG